MLLCGFWVEVDSLSHFALPVVGFLQKWLPRVFPMVLSQMPEGPWLSSEMFVRLLLMVTSR